MTTLPRDPYSEFVDERRRLKPEWYQWLLQLSEFSEFTGRTFATRPSSPVAGMIFYFTDSTVNTWGSTITGGGTNKVLGWYNGTNWTVVAH